MYFDVAAAQYGNITRAQLRTSGLTNAMIDGLLARGLLVGIHRGVYRVAGSPVSWRQLLLAACLAAGPDAVASHRAAGALWGLEGIDEAIEVTVPTTSLPRIHGVRLHRTLALLPSDVTTVDGIRVTRVALTVIGLAAVVSRSQLGIALDDSLSRGLLTPAYLQRRLLAAGTRGRRGIANLQLLLDARPEGRALAHRAFERLLFALLEEGGLPRPEPHYPVPLPSGKTVFIDYAYPLKMVGVEADSYRHHSSRTQWSRDHTRNAALTALGWRILPVTYDDVTRHAERTLSLVRRALVADVCRVVPPRAG